MCHLEVGTGGSCESVLLMVHVRETTTNTPGILPDLVEPIGPRPAGGEFGMGAVMVI